MTTRPNNDVFKNATEVGVLTLQNGRQYYKDTVTAVARAVSQLVYIAMQDDLDDPLQHSETTKAYAKAALALIQSGDVEQAWPEYKDALVQQHVDALKGREAFPQPHILEIAQDILSGDHKDGFQLNVGHIAKQIEADAKKQGILVNAREFPTVTPRVLKLV